MPEALPVMSLPPIPPLSDVGGPWKPTTTETWFDLSGIPQEKTSVERVHQWKIEETGTKSQVKVAGGTVASQGFFGSSEKTVSDVATLAVSDGDFIYLEIYRDSATRELDGDPTVVADASIPDSDETTQYVKLGQVWLNASEYVKKIRQDQSSPIRIFEDLAVVNGEFKLASLDMACTNPYDVPPP